MLTGRYIEFYDCNRGFTVRYISAQEGITAHYYAFTQVNKKNVKQVIFSGNPLSLSVVNKSFSYI